MFKKNVVSVLVALLIAINLEAQPFCTEFEIKDHWKKKQELLKDVITLELHAEAFRYYSDFSACPDSFFSTPLAQEIALNLISFQHPKYGAWDKFNYHDGSRSRKTLNKNATKTEIILNDYGIGTIDNHQTTGQIWFLLRVHSQIKQDTKLSKTIESSISQSLKFLFNLQTKEGGIMHGYPLDAVDARGNKRPAYYRFVKINQGSMLNVMQILQHVGYSKTLKFVSQKTRAQAQKRYYDAIEYLLKSQLRVNGETTGWAHQYGPNYQAEISRKHEIPGIVTIETKNILLWLINHLRFEKELNKELDPRVLQSIHSGMKWLKSTEVHGLRLKTTQLLEFSRKQTLELDEDDFVFFRIYSLKNPIKPLFISSEGKVYEPDSNLIHDPQHLQNLWSKFEEENQKRSRTTVWILNSNLNKHLEKEYRTIVSEEGY